MENKKDIGKAFREKLDQLDKSPNENLWDAIKADLKEDKKRRIIFIPFWMKMGGIFILGGLFTLFLLNSSIRNPLAPRQTSDKILPKISNDIENKDENINATVNGKTGRNTTKGGNGKTISSENTFIKESGVTAKARFSDKKITVFSPKKKVINPSEGNELKTKNSIQKIKKNIVVSMRSKQSTRSRLASKHKSAQRKNLGKLVAQNSEANPKRSNTLTLADKNEITKTNNENISDAENKIRKPNVSLEKIENLKTKKDTIALKALSEIEKDSTKTKEKNNFSLFVYGSPTYSGLIFNTSPIDKRLASNSVKSKITWSYGAYLNYEATPKWSLRFGIGMTNLKLITENAPINVANYNYINYTENTNASIYNQSNDSLMNITQSISYIEIPIELKYAIINKKFGVNAFGGISYRFLEKNLVTAATQNGMQLKVGEMKNLASSSYSIHFGIGIDYKFSKRMRINFEPIIKYHLIDYKDTGKVNPYTLGILTGLQFNLNK